MSVFSQWCRNAHRQFSSHRSKLRLGQAREIMAAGLGHKKYASFQVQDLARLDQASYALIHIEAMVRRAAEIGVLLEDETCREVVRTLRLGRDGDGRYVVADDDLAIVTRILLLDTDHPARYEFARSLGGELDGTDASYGEPVVPLKDGDEQWLWRVRGHVNVIGADSGWSVPVVADVVFRRLGRRLFARGEIASLRRDGETTDYDPEYTTEYSSIRSVND